MNDNRAIIERLARENTAPRGELIRLIETFSDADREYAAGLAREVTTGFFGREVYTRGLIEISSFCKKNCYYCGLRRGNKSCERYRLSEEEILACCAFGDELGFKTFVLQGGEDDYYTDELMREIVSRIRREFPDTAITLSLGERSRAAYQGWFEAGADRYLLRHETSSAAHYSRLHPPELSLKTRMECLRALKEIGYQTGCGNMVGAPFQTAESLADDLLFMAEFKPAMIGIGPFIPHRDTPFKDEPAGSVPLTLLLLSVIRLMHPRVLLPATTALGTAQGDGRELGVLAGANVIMPSISPSDARRKYLLYDGKVSADTEAADALVSLRKSMERIGYTISNSRGDYR